MNYQLYNARTHFVLAVIVLVVVIIVGAVVTALAYRMVRESVREGRRVRNIMRFLNRQNDAIVNTIAEIESAPQTYGGFPQALLTELMALHSEYPSATTGRINREIS